MRRAKELANAVVNQRHSFEVKDGVEWCFQCGSLRRKSTAHRTCHGDLVRAEAAALLLENEIELNAIARILLKRAATIARLTARVAELEGAERMKELAELNLLRKWTDAEGDEWERLKAAKEPIRE